MVYWWQYYSLKTAKIYQFKKSSTFRSFWVMFLTSDTKIMLICSNSTIGEHPILRINIVLTSMPLIMSKFLRMQYEFYLYVNGKIKHFTWIWESFSGNFVSDLFLPLSLHVLLDQSQSAKQYNTDGSSAYSLLQEQPWLVNIHLSWHHGKFS